MSLINDALKRAREAQQKSPPPGAPPLPPVEFTARGGPGWILAAAAIILLVAACFLIGLALFGHKTPPVTAVAAPAIPMPLSAETAPAPVTSAAPPRIEAAPAPATNTSPLTTEAAPVAATNAPPPPATVTNPPPPVVVAEQRPKVQGIIFNSDQPLAIINGKTVNVGDRVGDFQVKQILKTSVILQCPDGSQKTLVIGE